MKVLTTRALNRALLARQLLLRRARRAPLDALEHLVGLQAQNPPSPYLALAARLSRFDPASLSALVADRAAVRLALMRSTIHLVSARDALALRPVVQPASTRAILPGGPWSKPLAGLEHAPLAAAARALVDEQPRTVAELGKLLAARFPDRDPPALAQGARALLPLVQVPPRGMWRRPGAPRVTTAERYLGAPLAADASPDALLLRYLAAFGPASPADAQTWSGLGNLREAFERLRPRLLVFRDERGRELYDLPGAPRPSERTAAPVRLLPDYDNLLLSHADRTRVIDDATRRALAVPNGVAPGTVLVDGFVRGSWKLGDAALVLTPLADWSRAERAAAVAEGEGLLALLAPDAPRRRVTIR